MANVAFGHMHLYFPPTLKGDNNPFTQGDADPYLNFPYGCCGPEVKAITAPCKGHLDLLDTDEGKPVVTWAPGQKANFTLSGAAIKTSIENPEGGNHYGGSCQVGFSTDKGKTFKVAATWQGNCPLRNGGEDPAQQVFDFEVPADIASGNAVLAWTWINREKEFNMNCASVMISGDGNNDTPQDPVASSTAPTAPTKTSNPNAQPTGNTQYTLEGCTCECPSNEWTSKCSCQCDSPSKSKKRHIVERKVLALHRRNLEIAESLKNPIRRATASVAFKDLPDMLLSIDTDGADCESPGNPFELQFPNPGTNVIPGDGEYELSKPTGNCVGGVVGTMAQ
ncbi:hypothetical protein BDV96DRAFT_641816 [Lophiotrema nucula]|uniref:Lytic polysaccharide monooxygenase n=1 Tax=Lophiotrema nucula TaxID=690887 RepID=A0A6A5ZJX2_9PLEO|nr:hypothetical protein BDV96DRAFT_641816 [Lophiotrema nucula]